jgi:small-conductance mechanosensitive channel
MDILDEFWKRAIYSSADGTPVTVGDVLLVLLALLAGYLISRLIEFFLARRLTNTTLRSDAVYTIRRVSFYVILCLMLFTALSLLGIPLTVFAFATGAIAVGIGFGAQNIINNFISGWILMAERPLRIGDFIEIDGGMGEVERVGTRSTLIKRTDGVHLLVPNSKLLENTVVNWTLIDQNVRTSVRVGVAYGSDYRLVEKLIFDAVRHQPDVLSDAPLEVIFEDFGDSALIFDSFFWCDVKGDKTLRKIRSEIRFRIGDLFKEHNIEIAFPQQDVHLYSSKPLKIDLQN